MRLEWSPLAMDDRERIFDFIEQDDPRAAIAVDERIATQVLVLLRFPEGGPSRAHRRDARTDRSPHAVHRGLSGWKGIAFASCEFFTARSCGPAN